MKRTSLSIALALAAAVLPLALGAQSQGPMSLPAPPPATQRSGDTPFSVGPKGPSPITSEPPDLPAEQIIQKFAASELDFRREREQFTYEQSFVFQTLDADGGVDGEYRMTSAFVFDKGGKRMETVLDAPMPSLKRVLMTKQDLDDLEHVQPFVLTSEELPKYDVSYIGRQQLDEIATYVFDVAPKKIEKNQRYFQGRIWVDQRDLEIVKTFGKAVPDIRKKNGEENVFPKFETFRENIEGPYWFPTYTRSNDVLHFIGQDVRIRMIVRYQNYKRFGTTIKFGTATEIKTDKPNPEKPKPDKP